MKQCPASFALSLAILITACATGDFAPPPSISPSLVTSARPDGADTQKLVSGRGIFVSRCLECHTLPPVARYTRGQWPHLVARMSGRARLTPGEQDAVTAYLRAASTTGKRKK